MIDMIKLLTIFYNIFARYTMKQTNSDYQKLVQEVDEFDKKRDWIGLSPSDLAKSISIESSELLEHYQWDESLRAKKKTIPSKNIKEIESEAADILIYLLKFCREAKVDLIQASLEKLEKTKSKYPDDYKKHGDHKEYLRIKKDYRKKK